FHTTTVEAGPRASDGDIEVVDNAGPGGAIAEHWVNHDSLTDPASITIYRLTPDHLYLTNGTDQDDTIRGTAWNDDIRAGLGNDLIYGSTGADTIDGGPGTNTVSYAYSTAGVTANLQTGTGVGGDAQGDTFANIQNLTGSGFNDTLTGNAGANALTG